MAIYLKFLWSLKQLAVFMNVLITLLMLYLFWLYLSQGGMTLGWGWLIAIPLVGIFLVGPPLLTTIAIYADGRRGLKMMLLLLNLFILAILFCGLFFDRWDMDPEMPPFTWRSFSKACLILGAPFLINVATLFMLLLSKQKSLLPQDDLSSKTLT